MAETITIAFHDGDLVTLARFLDAELGLLLGERGRDPLRRAAAQVCDAALDVIHDEQARRHHLIEESD